MASSNGARSILDLIGSTPVVKLRSLPGKDDAEVWAKMESFNPGGSVKDRICLNMIETAERQGKIKPGATIVESTSGNTGIGLALIAAVKGYKLILTMPDTMSEERRSLLSAYGAHLVLTPDTKGMGGAIHKAEELLQENGDFYMPQQFNNPANPEMHRKTTALELLKQFKRIDAFVAGVGTGGTITGVGEVLKEKMKGVRICAVEPASSPVISGGEPGYHKIQGIGAGFIPAVLNRGYSRRSDHGHRRGSDSTRAQISRRGRTPGWDLIGRRLLRRVKSRAKTRQRPCGRHPVRRQGRALPEHRSFQRQTMDAKVHPPDRDPAAIGPNPGGVFRRRRFDIFVESRASRLGRRRHRPDRLVGVRAAGRA